MTGTARATRSELVQLTRHRPTQLALVVCLAAPLLFVAVLAATGTAPADTLLGRWVRTSGFAVPLVALGFAGQWGLPALVALTAGDVFSAEDRQGTWPGLLTRSAGRGVVFTAKVLAASAVSLALVVVLGTTSVLAGTLLVGTQPVPGLSGQLLQGSGAWAAVTTAWLTQLPVAAGFAAVAVLLSVVSRSSVVGVGGPVVVGLAMQLGGLVALPTAAREALLATGFGAWHGLLTTPRDLAPLWHSCLVSALYVAVCLGSAWAVFARRDVRAS